MRKRYDKEFKAKVAVEALKGDKTLQELAITYSVHPNMIALWKRQLLENASMLFEKEGKDKASEEAERQKDELFKQIGQLQVENEFLKKVQTTVRDRTEMVEKDHPVLSIAQQCTILEISRSSYYYEPKEVPEDPALAILEAILEVLKEKPFYGYRRIARELAYLSVTRKQIRRIMKKAGLRAIYPGLQLSKPSKGSKKYPYVLKGINIWLPNQVWASEITYINLSGGYVYMVTIIDLYSKKILAWQVSNTMDSQFCVAALEEAIAHYGIPGIFNTDQGSQFASDAFVSVLEAHGIRISMDSLNRALDNIFVERFWRSLKYEDIYLKDYRTMPELKDGLARYLRFYNSERFHQSLEYETPDTIYSSKFQVRELKNVA